MVTPVKDTSNTRLRETMMNVAVARALTSIRELENAYVFPTGQTRRFTKRVSRLISRLDCRELTISAFLMLQHNCFQSVYGWSECGVT